MPVSLFKALQSQLIATNLSIMAGLSAVGSSGALAMADCNFHCTEKQQSAEQLCQWMKSNTGTMPPFVPIEVDGVQCRCGCSCVLAGTLIRLEHHELPIEGLQVGDNVINPWSQQLQTVDLVTTTLARGMPLIALQGGGESLVATENHVLIGADGLTKKAVDLRPGDFILAAGGDAVEVESTHKLTVEQGTLHNLILNQHSSMAGDHVVVTNGLMSGDWMLQVTSDVLAAEIAMRDGTSAYIDNNNDIVFPNKK